MLVPVPSSEYLLVLQTSKQRQRFTSNKDKYKTNNGEFMAADFDDEDVFREDKNDYDIIIIGAGLAGLTCAYNILKKNVGLDVLIIEANSDVGGRVLSEKFIKAYHANSTQEHVTKLMNKLKISDNDRIYKNQSKETILYTKGKALRTLPRFYAADVHHFLQTIKENALDHRFSNYTAHEDAKYLAETSVEQFLREVIHVPYARTLCRAYVCSTCAIRDLKNISTLWFMVMLNSASGFLNRWKTMVGDGNRYFFKGGVSRITKKLLENILQEQGTIRYVDPVNEIVFSNDRVYVYTEQTHFRCEYVVVAIPPSLHSRIAIKPFRCQLNSESLYTPAENVFFNIVYKEPFSSDNSVKDIITTWDNHNNLNIAFEATHDTRGRVVVAGFLAKPNMEPRQGKGLIDTLSECYGTEASAYEQYRESDESLIIDQLKAGYPMSAMRPSSIEKHINCTGVPYERIYFASSEYATNWPGTIDGAIQSGEDTAYAILLRIRPQALMFDEIATIGVHAKQMAEKNDEIADLKMSAIQYLGILLHIAIFISFLRVAYD